MKAAKWNTLTGMVLMMLAVGLSSCSKDVDDELSLLGNWIEEAPTPGRTELLFQTGNRVTQTDSDGHTEVFSYVIEDGSIFLWPEGQSRDDGASELLFKQIDENTFQIGNLYPSIPEEEPTYIILNGSDSSAESEGCSILKAEDNLDLVLTYSGTDTTPRYLLSDWLSLSTATKAMYT